MKKDILLLGSAVLGGVGPAAAQSDQTEESSPKRPNILFCIADDASWLHFGAYGSRWVRTPVFDSVASRGVLFENCYTPNAKSAPSRASLLTGRYPWQLREAANHICRFPEDIKVFTEVLSEAGYDVAFTGKGWAPGDPGRRNGKKRLLTGEPFQDRKLVPPTPKILANDYAANFNDFLESRADSEKPWFFWFGCREPHRGYEYGSGVRLGGRSLSEIDRVPAFWPDNEEVRTDLLDYGFEVEYYDRQLGRMLELLEERGELDHTIVIVTSDNGMPFPRAKGTQYEYGHHMPLAVMWIDGIRDPGRRETACVSFVDVAPSILDVAGVAPGTCGMDSLAGYSIVPLLENRPDPHGEMRSRVLLGRERHDNGRPGDQGYPIRGIIRDGWLYVCNLKPDLFPGGNPETGYRDIDSSPTKTSILRLCRDSLDRRYYDLAMGKRAGEELYQVSVDRECLIDRSADPSCRARLESLRSELFGTLREQGDPRMGDDGDVFDRYPYDKSGKERVYEKTVRGEIIPWEESNWVIPTDYEQYEVK